MNTREPFEPVETISAVTLRTVDMTAAVAFYQKLGFALLYGGPGADFTSFRAGTSFLNLQLDRGGLPVSGGWGRVVFWVRDVDQLYQRALDAGFAPQAPPADASWGERYFHIRDPDGHELSLARPLEREVRRGS
jgi:catechol 2,3-dioxygenase-like lactoylglutathione lyase family enzyme